MKWIRESMTQIDLVDGEKKLAYIAYKNFRWLLYEGGEEWDEFENPTPLTKATMAGEWRLHKIIPCTPGPRKRSITELLFYMLRSGK